MAQSILIWTILYLFFIPQITDSSELSCIKHNLKVNLKNKFKFEGKSIPITIESSQRPSHRITSHILQILLHEVLGYNDVRVLSDYNTLNQTQIMNRIGACPQNSCNNEAPRIPDTMVNLEVWSQSGLHHKAPTVMNNVINLGSLGPKGQLGWYMPTQTVDSNWVNTQLIIDHWRAFRLSNVTAQFSLTNQMDKIRTLLYNDGDVNCDKNCDNYKAFSSGCRGDDSRCAVLLSSYPGYDLGVLERQIDDLALNVSVAWIGSNLDSFVHERTRQVLPTVFLNWTPNILTYNGNYTRIHLPACQTRKKRLSNQNPSLTKTETYIKSCDFPTQKFVKIVWSELKQYAPAAYHVIQQMHFSQKQYKSLLQLHTDTTGLSSMYSNNETLKGDLFRQIACDWIQENKEEWVKWLPNLSSEKQKIYIGAMFPLTGPYRRLPGIIPGAKLALEHINTDKSLLGDYEIVLLVKDTQCKTDIAMREFMHLISNATHPIAGLLGPGCAEVAENIAGVSKHFNRVVVSYSAEGLHLSQRNMFQYLYRTVPPITQNGAVTVHIFQQYNWHQVVLLAEEGEFSEYHQYLEKYFQDHLISPVLQRNLPRPSSMEDADKYLNEVLSLGTKIVILTSFEVTARAFVCQAYKKGMTSKQGYVWFLPHWFTTHWWDTQVFNQHYEEQVPCTRAEMLDAIQGHFTLNSAQFGEEGSRTIAGHTVEQWKKLYTDRLINKEDEFTEYASYVYDSLWVFALALDALVRERPDAINFIANNTITNRFLYHMNQTNFQGVSGRVKFSNLDRTGVTLIYQQQENDSLLVGSDPPDNGRVERGKNILVLNNVIWYGGDVPNDSIKDELCVFETLQSMLDVSCEMTIVIVNIVAGVCLTLCVLAFVIIIKIRYDKKVKVTRKRMEELGLMQDSNILSLDEWEISRENVVLNRKLGEGAFGTVYGGEAKVDVSSEHTFEWGAVAIKTLKIGSNSEQKLDFLTEADMMKRFRHNNIVKLLGVCTRGEPAYTIMEFMLYGDLKTFLLDRRHLVGQTCTEASDVSNSMLTKYALDIASGLQYLASLKYVHRDVACRNCLVHASKTVKLSDFGMARPVFYSDYYRFNRKGMLPVRWMAPESLIDGIFRHSSDIWGYGIVLYEIITFGSFPYQGLSNTQVLDFVRDGNTIDLPHNTSSQLKDLISACWRFNPDDRYTADEIVKILTHNASMVDACLVLPQQNTMSLNSLPYTYQDFRTFQLKLKKRPSAMSSQIKMFNSMDKLPTIKRSVSRLTLVADDPSVFYWAREEVSNNDVNNKESSSAERVRLKSDSGVNVIDIESTHGQYPEPFYSASQTLLPNHIENSLVTNGQKIVVSTSKL